MADRNAVEVGFSYEGDNDRVSLTISADGQSCSVAMTPQVARHVAGLLLLNAKHIEEITGQKPDDGGGGPE